MFGVWYALYKRKGVILMNEGTLIAVNGAIYEYGRFDEQAKVHLVYEVDIDCEGMLTATHIMNYLYPEQLAEGFNQINLTKDQWYGIVAHFIREGDFHLNEEEIEDATEDIVGRCFVYGIPKFHELPEYIADYMNR
jgi:hypothetical protein